MVGMFFMMKLHVLNYNDVYYRIATIHRINSHDFYSGLKYYEPYIIKCEVNDKMDTTQYFIISICYLFKNIEKFNDYTYIINNRLQFQFRFSYTDINNSIQVVNIKNNSGRTFYEYSEILGFLLSESKK